MIVAKWLSYSCDEIAKLVDHSEFESLSTSACKAPKDGMV